MTQAMKAIRIWGLALALCFGLVGLYPTAQAAGEREKQLEWMWTKKERKKIESRRKKIKKDNNGFWQYETESTIIKSDLSKQFVAELALYMSVYMSTFRKLFPMPKGGVKGRKVLNKMIIAVYKNKSGYLSSSRGIPSWSGGVFWADWNVVGWPKFYVSTYPWNEKNPADFTFFNRTVLQHEGTHALIQLFVGKRGVPIAFTEGCASYFEFWDVRFNKLTKAQRTERNKRSRYWRHLSGYYASNPDFAPSLHRLLSLTPQSWSSDGGGDQTYMNYALAETFIDFLLASSKGRKTFRSMVKVMFQYKMRDDLLTDKKINKLEPKWQQHIKDNLIKVPEEEIVRKSASLTKKQLLKRLEVNFRPDGSASYRVKSVSGELSPAQKKWLNEEVMARMLEKQKVAQENAE